MGTILIIIILGLITLALLLIAQFNQTYRRDATSTSLERSILGARTALITRDCDEYKAALNQINKSLMMIPRGITRYDDLKKIAEKIKSKLEALIESDC